MPQYAAWPAEIEYALPELARTKHQDFIETQMDAGPPHRRAKSSPYNVYTGILVFDQSGKDVFDHFVGTVIGTPFWLPHPDAAKPVLVAFAKEPFVRQQSYTVGEDDATFKVEVLLKVLSGGG